MALFVSLVAVGFELHSGTLGDWKLFWVGDVLPVGFGDERAGNVSRGCAWIDGIDEVDAAGNGTVRGFGEGEREMAMLTTASD